MRLVGWETDFIATARRRARRRRGAGDNELANRTPLADCGSKCAIDKCCRIPIRERCPDLVRRIKPPALFTATAGCRADFDGSGVIAVPDIFAYLSAWFAQDSAAEWDGIGGIAVPDIFAFLSAWFAAAGPC